LYQRVSVNDSNQNEELPASESCMADEDEEDGEVRHHMLDKLLKKLNQIQQNYKQKQATKQALSLNLSLRTRSSLAELNKLSFFNRKWNSEEERILAKNF
jgi:uncharacterized protein YcbK (DUF882 family)